MARPIILLLATLALAAPAAPKPDPDVAPNPPRPRQGGDTFADAFVFDTLIFTDTGATTGYADDYDEACPYDGSTSPDVVYRYAAANQWALCEYAEIDLFGSTYDTKVYVYDSQLELKACNDDFYPDYVSRIESFGFFRGEEYYIVIDGWGGDHGDYVLNLTEYACCYVACPPGYLEEDEILLDGLPDTVNAGCDGDPNAPAVMALPAPASGVLDFCGTTGWHTVGGEVRRDFDWFSLNLGPTGLVEGIFADNLGSTVEIILPGACGALEVQFSFVAVPCSENPMTITGEPGAEVWLRIATPDLEPGCGGYTPQAWPYVLELEGLQQPVATSARSWSAVKAVFRGGSGR